MNELKKRDYLFDNAKFWLIFLVIFGHALEYFTRDVELVRGIYSSIYVFHMPAFIFIAGYFTKKKKDLKYFLNVVGKVVVPYLVFQYLYVAFDREILGSQLEFTVFNPYWALWFLFSLFCWQVMLMILEKVPNLLFWSLLGGLAIGLATELNNLHGISRTIGFFPFFVLGNKIRKEQFSSILDNKVVKITSAVMLIVTPLVFVYILKQFSYGWFWFSYSYQGLGTDSITGIKIRMAVYVVATVFVFGFLSLMPKVKRFYSGMGSASLYGFLFHGFFIRYFIGRKMISVIDEPLDIALFFVASLLLTMLLTNFIVKKLSQPLVETSTFIKGVVSKLVPISDNKERKK